MRVVIGERNGFCFFIFFILEIKVKDNVSQSIELINFNKYNYEKFNKMQYLSIGKNNK